MTILDPKKLQSFVNNLGMKRPNPTQWVHFMVKLHTLPWTMSNVVEKKNSCNPVNSNSKMIAGAVRELE